MGYTAIVGVKVGPRVGWRGGGDVSSLSGQAQPEHLSAHALGSPLPPGVLLRLTRGSGTGQQVYRSVWCCVP